MATIIGTGSYLPRTVVTDDSFADERFRLRAGSARRRHAAADETSGFMAAEAARSALDAAGVTGAELDLIVGYAGMPDFLYPKDTNLLIEELGASQAAAWTLDTACATSISALSTVDALIEAGRVETALIVTTMSWVTRGIDRETTDYSSIGDGAAALVVRRGEGGLIDVAERTDPEGFDFVQLRSPFATNEPQHIEFSADPKYRQYFGVTVLEIARQLLEANDSPDWFVPHQVGPTLLGIWCDQLGIERDKLLHTYAETGNMSAVNIPHILDVHVRNGTIRRGDRVLFFAPGAGMHLAAMLWEY